MIFTLDARYTLIYLLASVFKIAKVKVKYDLDHLYLVN
jgi:hypothetical protein